jgi:hypothetical protein
MGEQDGRELFKVLRHPGMSRLPLVAMPPPVGISLPSLIAIKARGTLSSPSPRMRKRYRDRSKLIGLAVTSVPPANRIT